MLLKLLCVGIGGFFGCISRFLIVQLTIAIDFIPTFPWGTLVANALGCFLIGLIGGYIELKHMINPNLNALVITGFLGGLTTFSSFGLETMTLFREAHLSHALFNIASQLLIGFTLVWVGFRIMYTLLQ